MYGQWDAIFSICGQRAEKPKVLLLTSKTLIPSICGRRSIFRWLYNTLDELNLWESYEVEWDLEDRLLSSLEYISSKIYIKKPSIWLIDANVGPDIF